MLLLTIRMMFLLPEGARLLGLFEFCFLYKSFGKIKFLPTMMIFFSSVLLSPVRQRNSALNFF